MPHGASDLGEGRRSGNEGAVPVVADRKATMVGRVCLNDAGVEFNIDECAALLAPLSNSQRKHSLVLSRWGCATRWLERIARFWPEKLARVRRRAEHCVCVSKCADSRESIPRKEAKNQPMGDHALQKRRHDPSHCAQESRYASDVALLSSQLTHCGNSGLISLVL